MVIILAGYILPGWYGKLIPPERRAEGTEKTVPGELKATEGTAMEDGIRAALGNDAENALFEQSSGSGSNKPEVKDEVVK